MRVLSFIPAFLLAAAGFVAAAPTAPSTSPATNAIDSCTPSANDVNTPDQLRPVIAVITGVTARIQPLNTQLGGYTTSPNPDEVKGVVIQVTAILQQAVVDIKAAVNFDVTEVKLWAVVPVVFNLLSVVTGFFGNLVVVVKVLGVTNVVGELLAAISDLIVACGGVVVQLRVFAVANMAVMFGSLFVLVIGQLNLLSAILSLKVVLV